MAEALKNQFGPEIPRRLARTLAEVDPLFPSEAFLRDALSGYEALPLLPRARHLAHALSRHLPEDYSRAIEILLRSLGPKLTQTEGHGMAPFFYLPHTFFVAEYGLEHFEPSMLAQYELTQRFTAEFSIRPFLERHTEKTLARLRLWASDPSVHVRRLVSEGTRPRLPWAPRLQQLRRDPSPALELLEMLKDDPESYVRRSVANHLNDLGKEHPEWLLRIAEEWSHDAPKPRCDLLRHALRSLLKQKHPTALQILGYAPPEAIEVAHAALTPSTLHIGESTTLSFHLSNRSPHPQNLRADFRVHFVRADGRTSPKVFRVPLETLAPGAQVICTRKISLAHKSTRRHYPGIHRVEIQLNGEAFPAGCFELLP